MLIDVISVQPEFPCTLHIIFEDGVEATVDLRDLVPLQGVFAPMAEWDFFRQVFVQDELGTICWPNGADLDSEALYSTVTGKPLPFWAEVEIDLTETESVAT
jgi:hypothetical protein